MNAVERKYINDIAGHIRKALDISIPINNLESIVNLLGGSVTETAGFDDSCEGTIRKTGDESFAITISPDQNQRRKNFTIAHELGHLFLHMGFLTDSDLWKEQDQKEYRRFGSSEEEYQANEFAAALLMPIEEYDAILRKKAINNRVNIQEIADYFNVSYSAAKNRGIFLGYFS